MNRQKESMKNYPVGKEFLSMDKISDILILCARKIRTSGSPHVITRKPRDAKRRSSGQIFLSNPRTHDRLL